MVRVTVMFMVRVTVMFVVVTVMVTVMVTATVTATVMVTVRVMVRVMVTVRVMTTVYIIGKSILVELPDGAKALIGVIEIACPSCGAGQWTIMGHHMRACLRILAEWVDKHPELTGPEQITIVKQESWSGKTGGDPTQN